MAVSPPAAYADTLQVTGTLVFDSRQFTVNPSEGFSAIVETYRIDIPDLVVPLADYDRIEFEITAGPGQRFEATDIFPDNFGIVTRIDVSGGEPNRVASASTHDLAFVGGTGDLPGVDPSISFGFTSDEAAFVLRYDGPNSLSFGSYGFESITFGRDLSPAETRSGTFVFDQALFRVDIGTSEILAEDPGRFSGIVPVPEPSSLALLGVAGFLIARRRRD
ncbi:MAG: PEP-CTERM sorting domain-containing protein [Planctomycetota bacterium]